MKQPIIKFKDIGQAYQCMHEWKKKLFLDNWVIKLSIVDNILSDDGVNLAGQNAMWYGGNGCEISISNEISTNKVLKQCQEVTLVHEMLHCKYNWLVGTNTIEGKYLDAQEHALLEQMAKTLIMVKYNINYDWFKDFSEE